jgi:tetratricopeptide (TPR) repeat protein
MFPISLISGVALIVIDRITEIPVPYIGAIKTAEKQATSDAEKISKLKERIEAQSATIDLVAQNATDAKKLSTEAKSLYEDLSNKNKIADKELKNISDKILPLEVKADSLSTLTKKTRKEILHMQERLNIQKLMIASKAGSRSDYEKLTKIAGKISRIHTYANTALEDIFFYFDAERNIEGRILLDRVTGKPILYTVDEVIDIYHNTDTSLGLRESAINTLAKLKKDTAVQEICDSIDKEQNLRVIARMIRALSILTGKYFETLDINKVKIWWENDTIKKKYKSCYKGLLAAIAIDKRSSFRINKKDITAIVSLLKETIEADPDALYSRCLLGFYYTQLKDFENAEKEFNEVEHRNSNNNYRWFFFFKAVFFLLQEKPNNDAAIAFLNRAMEISPTLETTIKTFPPFKDILENTQLIYPSIKK